MFFFFVFRGTNFLNIRDGFKISEEGSNVEKGLRFPNLTQNLLKSPMK